MDSAQKRAILAILGMIESGIQQMKMLLSVDGPEAHILAETPRPSGEPTHLSEEEDQLLERQIERERRDLMEFEKKRAQSLWADPLFGDDDK